MSQGARKKKGLSKIAHKFPSDYASFRVKLPFKKVQVMIEY